MIVPGAPNPLMLCASNSDPLDELGIIDRSVRLRPEAGGHLSRPNNTPTNRAKWTLNTWMKYLYPESTGALILSSGTTGADYASLRINNGALMFAVAIGNVPIYTITTTKLLRDTSNHFNLHVSFDCGNSVATSRFIVRINNGSPMVYTGTAALNLLTYLNSTMAMDIGWYPLNGQYIGANLSHWAFVDGEVIEPSVFVTMHPLTGQCRPRDPDAIRTAMLSKGSVRNGWGMNGHFLEFKKYATQAELGIDTSQAKDGSSGNNWDVYNVSVLPGFTKDVSKDTPTNNFPTFSRVSGYIGATFDLVYSTNLAAIGIAHATMALPNYGEWYWEVSIMDYTSGGECMMLGVVNLKANMSSYVGADANGWGIYSYSGKYNANVSTAYGTTFGPGSVVGMYYNGATRSLGCFVNGVWQGIAFSNIPNTLPLFPAVSDASGALGSYISINFGQRDFVYPASMGAANALCTKNLRLPAIPKSSNGVIVKAGTRADVLAGVASDTANWNDWIRLYKRLPNGGSYIWQFSDDPDYYFGSAYTDGRVAFTTAIMESDTYHATALRVGSTYGIATGRFNHTVNTPGLIVDNLANSRKIVMLMNEAGGNWFFYHPDLQAGTLLIFNNNSSVATNDAIQSVMADRFNIRPAFPTGTYRWISIAETEDFSRIWSYTGTPSLPFIYEGFTPITTWWKDIDTASTNWHMHDTVRDEYNPSNRNLMFNLVQGEDNRHSMDFLGNGRKLRGTEAGSNATNARHVGVSFAGFPLRYSNAR